MALIVQKFGGTSVGDAERIRAVADHVARTKSEGNDVVVVVSAMGKQTDELLRLADEVREARGAEVRALVPHVEDLPERLQLYADDGEALLSRVVALHVPIERALVRRATLEDVFLRLTGRSLID